MTNRKTLQQTVDAVARCGGIRPAARELGIDHTTVMKRMTRASAAGIKATKAATDAGKKESEPAVNQRTIFLQDRVNRLQKELKEIARSNLEAESVRSAILGLSETALDVPTWLAPLKPANKTTTGTPCTIWSDWHLGENVNRAEVNGVNEFSLAIAEQRIRRLVERVVDLCFRHMTSPEYPGIVVNLIGDIVSGDIHPELQETNDDQLFPVILWAVERLSWALTQMADHFGKVFVACAPGNHGRMTKKPQAKRYVVKNADWLIYNLLQRHFLDKGDSRVNFIIPATGECRYNVYGHRYLALHGDDLGVKGGDGIIGAIGPIMRGEIKVHGQQSQIDRDYDTLLMGHWHQMLWLPRAIVNNTLKGFDEFARRFLRAPATSPAQALWFTHPTRGITAQWEVRLDDQKAIASAPWVSWEADAPYHVGGRRAA